jgi:poly-gamma-glutamate capsule biosynthesis protein CapA/YwtB (metallophosphatase superfamily)
MRGRVLMAAICLLGCCCAGEEAAQPIKAEPGSVRLLFAGDVMVGRAVAPLLAAEGVSLFEDARMVVSEPDLALANLESALVTETWRVTEATGLSLVGSSDTAAVLAATGFDLLSIANNHTGDAGPGSVQATAAALGAAGIDSLGLSGVDPVLRDLDGVRVAFLAFDLTRGPGSVDVATRGWNPDEAAAAVAGARLSADVVVVSLHGGVEHLPAPDPALRAAVGVVAGAGADVVWVHGAHVVYPVEVVTTGNRPAVIAYGLGNFLFDQMLPGTTEGLVIEVLVDAAGVVAHRIGTVDHRDLRVGFIGWRLPDGDAVLLGGEWWVLSRPIVTEAPGPTDGIVLQYDGTPEALGIGDATRDGRQEAVVAFRRPYLERPVNARFPDAEWIDGEGNTAHLGLYRPEDLGPIWVASGLARPVDDLAVCDGTLAVSYADARRRSVASAAWTWNEFGFAVAPDLPGAAVPGCADVDGDGRLDPVLERSGDWVFAP